MNPIQAVILGIIQGISEFLPISSSAHLVLIPRFFNWESQTLLFDTTLHLGTAAALIVVFFKDLKKIVSTVLKDFWKNKLKFRKYSDDSSLGLKIIIGSIPAFIAGFFFGDFFESKVRGSILISMFLIAGSVLMILAEKFHKKILLTKDEISLSGSFKIGLFQALALFPGISRSGATISGGMLSGLNRENAARFSFLLSIPVVLGAGILQIGKSVGAFSIFEVIVLGIGFLVSFTSALFAIKFLLKFVKSNSLYPFVIYRMVLAVLILMLA